MPLLSFSKIKPENKITALNSSFWQSEIQREMSVISYPMVPVSISYAHMKVATYKELFSFPNVNKVGYIYVSKGELKPRFD